MPAPTGNQNAKKENRLITEALRRAVVQSPDKLRDACDAVLDKAANGDLAAFGVIADRLDGKPAQTIGSDPNQPFLVKLEGKINLVRPNR